MTVPLYLAVLEVWDPATGSTTSLYYASGLGHVTDLPGGGEDPAHTWFDPRIAKPPSLRRDLYSSDRISGASRVAFGDLVLLNGDGALDFLKDYGINGRNFTIWQGAPGGGASGSGFPTDFSKVLAGTMERLEFSTDTVTVKLRDKQLTTKKPLQLVKYAGTNDLPDGIEGVAGDLKGKPKSLCFGKVLNVPAVLVNTSKLIYQVHDGAVDSVDMVFDRGIPLIGQGQGTSRTGGFSGSVTDVAFGNGIFMAVGDDAEVATSPDGITWTQRSVAGATASEDFQSVAFGRGNIVSGPIGAGWWVVVALNGKVFYSADNGVNWLEGETPYGTSDYMYKVRYGGGRFMVSGLNGLCMYATFPRYWTAGGTMIASETCRGLTYGRGLWVAAGATGRIATSVDGVAWTLRESSGSGHGAWGAVFAADASAGPSSPTPGMFVVAGQISFPTGAAFVRTSYDGINWTVRSTDFGNILLTSIGYGGGMFVTGGGGILAVSRDAVNWSMLDSPLGATAINGIAFGDTGYGVHVLVGASNSIYSTIALDTPYSSQADIEDETQTPLPGMFKVYEEGGLFRVGAVPGGLITADVTGPPPLAQVAPDQEDFSQWAALGTIVVTGGQADPFGGTAADLVAANTAGARIKDTMVWTEGDFRCFGVFMKADTAAATRILVGVGANLYLDVTWTDGVPSLNQITGGGTSVAYDLSYEGWYFIAASFTGITGSTLVQIYPAASSTGDVYLCGAIAWDDDRVHPYQGPSLDITRTAAQFMDELFERAGVAWDEVNHADLTLLANANGAEIGYWTDREVNVDAVIDEVTKTVGAWWGADRAGEFRSQILTAFPSTVIESFEANDLMRPLRRIPTGDPGHGIPPWQTIVRWGRAYVVQDDLAGGVTPSRRALVSKEWREAKASNPYTIAKHLLSLQVIVDSLFTTEADALAEAVRRQQILGAEHDLYALTVPLDSVTETIDLGEAIKLTHARYGLSAGKWFRVLGIEPDGINGRLNLTVWGPLGFTGDVVVAPSLSGAGWAETVGSGGTALAPVLDGDGTIA